MSANNKCFFLGRFTGDPEVRYSQNGETAITRFRLGVNRRFKREGEPDADFINFVAFGQTAENIGKFFLKGSQILVESRCQTGSYENRDGQKVYTTDFIVEAFEFTQSSSKPEQKAEPKAKKAKDGEFVQIPKGDEDLPWD